MKHLKSILPVAVAAMIGTAVTVSAANVYVDPVNGNDRGNGSLNNPYKTITQARDAVRKINSNMAEDINVILRGGNYFIDDTIMLTTQDSGTNGYYVNYKAYPNEIPVINGAKQINNWTLHNAEKNIYKASAMGIETRHLYINGERAVRARTDKTLTECKKTDTGYICDDTYLADFRKPEDLEFSWVVLWTNPRCGVSKIEKNNDGKAVITMDSPGWEYITSSVRGVVNVAVPTLIENAYEFLDEGGEFYLDIDEDTFYYIPRDGEDMNTAVVYAPFVEQMLRIEGDNIDKKVHNIRLDGLHFEYTTWNRPSTKAGHSDTQCNYIIDTEGDYHRMIDAAVTIRRAVNVPVENCVISKVGNIALKLEDGTQYSDVTGNHIYDVSGTGIAIGEVTGAAATTYDSRYFCRGNDVRNNLVENVGIDFHSSVGISAGFPMESEISHNEIIGSHYSGMHIGYGWATHEQTGTNTRDFKIADNIVVDTMKTCHDGGGIYVLGATGGNLFNRNEVSGNYIYNSINPNGILYADEGSSYWTFKDNVVDQYGINAGNWYLIWKDTIHYVDFINNHTTRKNFTNEGSNCIEEGTEYAEDAEWSSEVLAVIDKAGLQPEYADKLNGFDKSAIGKIIVDFPQNVKKGDTIKVNYKVKAQGGYTLPSNEYTAEIISSDESIIKVEGNILNAVGEGMVDITINAEKNGKTVTTTSTIISDDVLVDIILNPANKYVALGTGKSVAAQGKTRFGKTITEGMNVSYQSLNPDVAGVNTEGVITAYKTGIFKIRASVEYDGVTVAKDFEYEALRPGDSKELDGYNKYKLVEETKSTSGWYTASGTAEADGAGIDLAGQFVTYQNRKFSNELIEFNLTLKGEISWPTIVFSNQKYDVCAITPNTNSYIIVINNREIELQRWINGTGTMIYGEAAGRVTIEKERIKNEYFKSGETAYVQVGAFDEANGVRIVFWVNGQKVIDYLDTSDEALRGGGYFGILEQTEGRKMRLSPPEVIVKDVIAQEEVFDDLDGHWSKQIVMDMYDVGLVKGIGNNKFAPDSKITRAEYITMALRAAKIEEGDTQSKYFSDSDSTKWYNGALNTALNNGLIDINIVKNDMIYPNQPITREEMASVAARICTIKKKNDTVSLDEYTDKSSISEWAEDAFEKACAYGIFKGNDDGSLNPQGTATRAEAVSVIKGINALNN